MTRIHLYISLLFGFISLMWAGECNAQTCRVKAGNGASGAKVYMEVYEYDYVKKKPSFPGGDAKLVAFINENRQYPAEAYKKRDTGQGYMFVCCQYRWFRKPYLHSQRC